ncbi:MAG: hypothetical protein AB1512_18160 [Thermodesulfobacteriota bacterium]
MVTVKTVGNSGQISLGKEYAGRHVLIDQIEEGVWLIKTGTFVPDSESWIHTPQVSAELDRAVAWAGENPPTETSPDELEGKLQK